MGYKIRIQQDRARIILLVKYLCRKMVDYRNIDNMKVFCSITFLCYLGCGDIAKGSFGAFWVISYVSLIFKTSINLGKKSIEARLFKDKRKEKKKKLNKL